MKVEGLICIYCGVSLELVCVSVWGGGSVFLATYLPVSRPLSWAVPLTRVSPWPTHLGLSGEGEGGCIS